MEGTSSPTLARHGHRSLAAAIAAVLFAVLLTAAPSAGADPWPLHGTVTSAGDPVAGAFVAVTGEGGQATDVSDGTGAWSVDLPDGTYDVAVQAPGYRVTQDDATIAGAGTTLDLGLTSSGAKFDVLPVYGAQVGSILSGGSSGVFYIATSAIPQLYRSGDYGGTWSPVTMHLDDPEHGLVADSTFGDKSPIAVSGHPGEIAVYLRPYVYASTDYGVTWRQIPATPEPTQGHQMWPELHWGHVGATSVLVMRQQDRVWRADMSSLGSAALTQMSTGYVSSESDLIAVANGGTEPYAAVLDAAGALRVYQLTPTGAPVQVGAALDGLPSGANALRFGGRTAAGAPPSAVLAYTPDTRSVRMAVKTTSATAFTADDLTNATTPPDTCWLNETVPAASIAPWSGGTAGGGSLAACYVRSAGPGEDLTLDAVDGINNNTGFVFDAGYDGADNQVIISGGSRSGVIKSASADTDGVPVFPDGDAQPGTDPSSGGAAINGLTVPVVRDTDYGPAGPDQIATVLSASGGALGYASADGGASVQLAVEEGGSSVDWWQGADGHDWLVFGHGGQGILLSAIADWTPATPTLARPNLLGVDSDFLGLPGGGAGLAIEAVKGIPGTDVLFAALARNGPGADNAGRLTRLRLNHGDPPTPSDVTTIASDTINRSVNALAYCPASGSAASTADVLLAGTGDDEGGALLRVADPTGADPAVAAGPATFPGPVHDVRVDCASGTVYAAVGRNMAQTSGGLYKSTDGGATFTKLDLGGLNLRMCPDTICNATSVAISPSDPSELLVALEFQGYVLRSTDGGASWSKVNDPDNGGRDFSTEGVNDLELPPPAEVAEESVQAADDDPDSPALVGTGGGLFSADIRPADSSGLYATGAASDWAAAARLTGTGGSAAQPAVAIDTADVAHVVYKGRDGLYVTSRPSGGGWSAPAKLPGTVTGDSTPSLARTPAGGLQLAFTRTSGNRGICTASKAAGGTWTGPSRRSSGSADSAPVIAVDPSGRAHLVFRRAGAGLLHGVSSSGHWGTIARVAGTTSADGAPTLAMGGSAARLAWTRSGSGAGTWFASKAYGHAWGTPRQVYGGGSTTPTLAVDSAGGTHLVTRTSSGLVHQVNRTGRWSTPVRVSGTRGGDVQPWLATAGTTAQLAFTRTSGQRGVLTSATGSTGQWGSPARRSTGAGDGSPRLAVDADHQPYLVFDRG